MGDCAKCEMEMSPLLLSSGPRMKNLCTAHIEWMMMELVEICHAKQSNKRRREWQQHPPKKNIYITHRAHTVAQIVIYVSLSFFVWHRAEHVQWPDIKFIFIPSRKKRDREKWKGKNVCFCSGMCARNSTKQFAAPRQPKKMINATFYLLKIIINGENGKLKTMYPI